MKRIELDRFGSTLNLIRELGLRPSFERRVKNDCFNNNIQNVRELCMKDEEELLKIPSFNSRFVSHLRVALAEYGLRFGMSEAELDDYMDKDFLGGLGRVKSSHVAKSVGNVVLETVSESSTEKSDDSESIEETAPDNNSVEVKESPFIQTNCFIASIVGSMMGYSLMALLELIITLILDSYYK